MIKGRIELRHLRTLDALVRHQGVAAAAEALYLTQSALSHQLKQLEEGIGTALFLRKTRPLRLTPAGERLLQLARRVLGELEAAEADLAKIADGRGGRLHVAIECHSCFQWLWPTLTAYRNQWPEVELDLTLSYGFSAVEALRQESVDAVITADPVVDPGLVYEPLFGFENRLLLPAGHRLAQARRIDPEDLAGETLITYPVEPERLDVHRRFLAPAGIELERRTTEVTAMLVQLVASRRGVAVLPQWALAEFANLEGELAVRSLGRQGLWSTLWIALRRSDAGRAYVNAFVETARSTCFASLEGLKPVRPLEEGAV